MSADLDIYRTPTLATLSEERLAAVVTDYRRELITLARDQAYAGAHWALELIDSLAGRVRELEGARARAAAASEPDAAPETTAPAETAAVRRTARVRG